MASAGPAHEQRHLTAVGLPLDMQLLQRRAGRPGLAAAAFDGFQQQPPFAAMAYENLVCVSIGSPAKLD